MDERDGEDQALSWADSDQIAVRVDDKVISAAEAELGGLRNAKERSKRQRSA
jgi:hypothetical protein